MDENVYTWWQQTIDHIYEVIPDFGGFVVKADSEGEPGPYQYGRNHVDGANMLAKPFEKYGGLVIWRTKKKLYIIRKRTGGIVRMTELRQHMKTLCPLMVILRTM